jgi:peptide/nickel transport system substrate-binding protein
MQLQRVSTAAAISTVVVLACLAGFTVAGQAQSSTPRDTLVMAANLDGLITFDPAQTAEGTAGEFLRNVCDPLVTYDRKDPSKVVPLTAERWRVSQDGKTLTVTLRRDLRFPSGRKATAEDAVWSMQRAVRLGFGAAAGLTQWGFTHEHIVRQIRAADDHTVVMTMDRAYPEGLVVPAVLGGALAYILDREEGMKHAKTMDGRSDEGNAFFRTNPICVGAYTLTRWGRNDVVVLERSDQYYGIAPMLKRVIIRHVPESGDQRRLLEQGEIDVAEGLNAADLRALASNRRVVIEQAPVPGNLSERTMAIRTEVKGLVIIPNQIVTYGSASK